MHHNFTVEYNLFTIFQEEWWTSLILTLGFKLLPKQPWADSAADPPKGVTGNDDVLLIRGVNIFERENDLDREVEIDDFSRDPAGGTPRARSYAFSMSKAACRFLKLNFGQKSFMDLDLEHAEPGEVTFLASLQLGVERKFTLRGVGLDVGAIFILTSS